jgi:hypothetical protein
MTTQNSSHHEGFTREQAEKYFNCTWKTLTNHLKELGQADTNPQILSPDLIQQLESYATKRKSGVSAKDAATEVIRERSQAEIDKFDGLGALLQEEILAPVLDDFVANLPRLVRQGLAARAPQIRAAFEAARSMQSRSAVIDVPSNGTVAATTPAALPAAAPEPPATEQEVS